MYKFIFKLSRFYVVILIRQDAGKISPEHRIRFFHNIFLFDIQFFDQAERRKTHSHSVILIGPDGNIILRFPETDRLDCKVCDFCFSTQFL